ncbi:MAG: hypothetical protein KJZ87_27480, partial [Thermoguttaceae bacterium]|nr:hypothetical protein [Thermoguttaceae bacterium]
MSQTCSVTCRSSLAILWLLLAISALGAEQAGYPPSISLDDVRQWVEKAPKEHPRLLASKAELAALRQSGGNDPLARMVAQAIIREATSLERQEPVRRMLEGRRLLGVSRQAVGRVLTLATAYHLTGDRQHADRCEREMLAAARFTDWNPSHFLDVGEMTF